MQTSVFVFDTIKLNTLIYRINKLCTFEGAYIIMDSVKGISASKIQVINKKFHVYGKLCVFQSVSISQIIEILNEPDELQPEGFTFNSSNVKACGLSDNKFRDAIIIGCEKGVF